MFSSSSVIQIVISLNFDEFIYHFSLSQVTDPFGYKRTKIDINPI